MVFGRESSSCDSLFGRPPDNPLSLESTFVIYKKEGSKILLVIGPVADRKNEDEIRD